MLALTLVSFAASAQKSGNYVSASGDTEKEGNVFILAEKIGSKYRLGSPTILLYDMYYGKPNDFTSSTTHFSGSKYVIESYYYLKRSIDYFYARHGRHSYDGKGGKVTLEIRDRKRDRPSASGSTMWFPNWHVSSSDAGLIGHEFTHLVLESAGLGYGTNENRAINESFANIFGEMVDLYIQGSSHKWYEDGGFDDPKAHNDADTYLGENYDKKWHSHGPHHYWFYLLSEGGSGVNDNKYSYSVKGIGTAKAEKIAYRSVTKYLPKDAEYKETRESSIKAARELYGSNSAELKAVVEAWNAVGVGGGLGPHTIAGANQVIAKHSSRAMSDYSGGLVTQSRRNNPRNMVWDFVHLSGNEYFIRHQNSTKYLDVQYNSYSPGANMIIWKFNGNNNQRFIVEPTGDGDGTYWIRPKSSKLYLTVKNGSNGENAVIIQDRKKNANYQKWKIDPVNTGSTPPPLTENETEDGVLGIDESTQDNAKMMVYPNPGTGTITINSNTNGQTALIQLTDARGNTVAEFENPSKQQSLDVSGMADGIYYVHRYGTDGSHSSIIFRKM